MTGLALSPWGPVQILLLVVGLGLLADAGWLAVTANLSGGTFLAAASGAVLGLWAVFFDRLTPWLNVLGGVGVVAVTSLAVFLAWFGSAARVDYHESAVIVLGAAVHGDELSATLQARLDTAYDYWTQNRSAIIVVSGGQGFQENLPEAVAMRRYLLGRGVPDGSIVTEAQATSTAENFSFSRQLLDARFAPGYQVAFVTDEFHVYRASQMATQAGLIAHPYPRSTLWYVWVPNFLREEVAVVRMWLLGNAR